MIAFFSAECSNYLPYINTNIKMASKHTIVLIQYSASFQSRSYMDFPTVNAAVDAVIKMYEHKLKELNPSVGQITYDVSDLYNFLDSLTDINALV